MNTIEQLNNEYTKITKMNSVSQIGATDNFTKKLLSDNSKAMLDYHFNLLLERSIVKLYNRIRISFSKRPKDVIEPYLIEKIQTEKNDLLIADAIQLLGNINSSKILSYVLLHIKSKNQDIRYRCIIVIGWIGDKNELPILSERMENDSEDLLRGYAATAMRQIWFRKKCESKDILPYLFNAIPKEESITTLGLMIIVIQDLLKAKFGLQEKINDAIITGDVLKAKTKVLEYIKNLT